MFPLLYTREPDGAGRRVGRGGVGADMRMTRGRGEAREKVKVGRVVMGSCQGLRCSLPAYRSMR